MVFLYPDSRPASPTPLTKNEAPAESSLSWQKTALIVAVILAVLAIAGTYAPGPYQGALFSKTAVRACAGLSAFFMACLLLDVHKSAGKAFKASDLDFFYHPEWSFGLNAYGTDFTENETLNINLREDIARLGVGLTESSDPAFLERLKKNTLTAKERRHISSTLQADIDAFILRKVSEGCTRFTLQAYSHSTSQAGVFTSPSKLGQKHDIPDERYQLDECASSDPNAKVLWYRAKLLESLRKNYNVK